MAFATQLDGTRRARLRFLSRWVLTLLILGVLVYFVPISKLREALTQIPLSGFLLVLLVYIAAVCAGAAKWHLVVNSADADLSLATSAQCYGGGLFGDLFLPSIIGGDVVRLAVGMERSPRPVAVITGNVADRILDITAQLTLVLFGLAFLPSSPPFSFGSSARRLVWTGALILGVACVLIGFFGSPLLRGRSIRVRRRLAQLRNSARAVSRRPYRLLLGVLIGICVQGTYLALTATLGMLCGLHLSWRVWLFAWPLSKIAAVLPVTQGGIGIREAALVALLAPFGAPAARVLATGIASEGVIIAGGLVAGLTALLLRRADARNSRRWSV